MPMPPSCSETVMPSRPRSPIFFHRSIGNWSLRSISAARGAISTCANWEMVSRSAAMSSPWSKLKPGKWSMSSSRWVGIYRDYKQGLLHDRAQLFHAILHHEDLGGCHHQRLAGLQHAAARDQEFADAGR